MTTAFTTAITDLVGESPSLELTNGERFTLEALVRRLAETAPSLVDDTYWLMHARLASCCLPFRVLEAIRTFRHDAGVDGMLTISNLPIAPESLPPTPSVPDSVEPAATVPAAIAVLLGQQLGEVIAYRDEKRGALVQNIVPVPALERSQSNGGSVPLQLHTENAFHPNRPDYVGLLCLRPAREGVGTHVASIRRALALLDGGDLAVLQQARFQTAAPPSFGSADRSGPHPVLNGGADDPDIRVDFHATSALDEAAAAALSRLREALMEVRVDLVLRSGDMVFLDNRLVVHGRSAFAPRYDGGDRWLHRVFVHLDNRRSRPLRAGNGSVLA
jgi:L-asparagine oxygenase